MHLRNERKTAIKEEHISAEHMLKKTKIPQKSLHDRPDKNVGRASTRRQEHKSLQLPVHALSLLLSQKFTTN